MKSLAISAIVFASLVTLVAPLSADHDRGHQKSQDHLHRKVPAKKNGAPVPPSSEPSAPGVSTQQIVAVPAPSSLALVVVGATILGLAALRRRP